MTMKHYFVYYTNFGYAAEPSFDTVEDALNYAKTKGFEATIFLTGDTDSRQHSCDIVASWGIFSGVKHYEH